MPVAFGASRALADIATQFHPGAALVAAVSLAVLFGWSYTTPLAKNKLISPALVVVTLASPWRRDCAAPGLALSPAHFVDVPLGGVGALAQGAAAARFRGVRQSCRLDRGRHHRDCREHRNAAVTAGRGSPDPRRLAQPAGP